MWHASSRSGVATLWTAIHLLLTYLVGSGAKPQPTNDLVHIGAECAVLVAIFVEFPKNKCNFLHKISLISYGGSNSWQGGDGALWVRGVFLLGQSPPMPYGSQRLWIMVDVLGNRSSNKWPQLLAAKGCIAAWYVRGSSRTHRTVDSTKKSWCLLSKVPLPANPI